MKKIDGTKYIFVTGGVVSSLGKGIVASSLGRLLKERGYKVTIQKFDPYLNVDPGTMSPYQHGEVFVTEDGAETDLDLGHYERFINENLTQYNNLTSGRIMSRIISKERRGDFLGGTVQFIPHVTDEIKKNIIREGNDLSNKAAELEKNVTLFNSKNRQVTGNLEVAQLGNEIMTSVLSSINSLNATLINQEAKRQELEMKEAEKQKAKNEIAKKRYLIETQRVIQNTETDVITIK